MAEFDYTALAELFAASSAKARRPHMGYRRFPQAAEAIRFAVEQLSPGLLRGSYLEVNETRYSGDEIEQLYLNEAYPLPRGPRVGVDPMR
jgi:hypothetical protein